MNTWLPAEREGPGKRLLQSGLPELRDRKAFSAIGNEYPSLLSQMGASATGPEAGTLGMNRVELPCSLQCPHRRTVRQGG